MEQRPDPVRVANYKGRSLFVHWLLPILAIGAIAIAYQKGCF
jgi:hypothetical protein